jgi:hypothetical protein
MGANDVPHPSTARPVGRRERRGTSSHTVQLYSAKDDQRAVFLMEKLFLTPLNTKIRSHHAQRDRNEDRISPRSCNTHINHDNGFSATFPPTVHHPALRMFEYTQLVQFVTQLKLVMPLSTYRKLCAYPLPSGWDE